MAHQRWFIALGTLVIAASCGGRTSLGGFEFDNPDPSGCSCSDTVALAAMAAKACGFPSP